MLAMQRAVAALAVTPERALVDGNRCPPLAMPAEAVVQGDGKIASIAAASILAKTARDRWMVELDGLYSGYGFAAHKGYGAPAHMKALRALGPCPEHRRTWAPIRDLFETAGK